MGSRSVSVLGIAVCFLFVWSSPIVSALEELEGAEVVASDVGTGAY